MLSLGFISYGAAAAGFLLLTLLLATSWEGRAQGIRLVAACAVTTLWAALLAWRTQSGAISVPLVLLAEFLRYGAWFVVLSGLARSAGIAAGLSRVAHVVWVGGAVLLLAIPVLMRAGLAMPEPVMVLANAGLVMALLGLILLEQLFRIGAKIKINKEGDKYSAVLVEQHKASNGIASDQQTPIVTGDFIWCVMPENAGPLKKQLVCYNMSDLTKPVWSSGKENRFGRGLGPYIVSGDKMYLLDDDGKLYLFRLQKDKVSLLSSHQILNGIEAWGPMAIAGDLLLMRDARNLLCLNIGNNR